MDYRNTLNLIYRHDLLSRCRVSARHGMVIVYPRDSYVLNLITLLLVSSEAGWHVSSDGRAIVVGD